MPMNERPNWTDTFMEVARVIGKRATCPVKEVGAVFVDFDTKSILSVGYNGAPRKIRHCGQACRERQAGERSDECSAVHAELNAIFNATHNGVNLNDSIVYITCSPCIDCTRALIQVGAKLVIYDELYNRYDESVKLLEEAGVAHFRYGFGQDCL